jgi:hypothetical protein
MKMAGKFRESTTSMEKGVHQNFDKLWTFATTVTICFEISGRGTCQPCSFPTVRLCLPQNDYFLIIVWLQSDASEYPLRQRILFSALNSF